MSIPISTSPVTKSKHSANLGGGGGGAVVKLDFMVKKWWNKTNYFGILNSTLYRSYQNHENVLGHIQCRHYQFNFQAVG